MKLAVFVDQFPVRSQTFVLNQVTGLIDLGVDITILSLGAGDKAIFNDDKLKPYNLAQRTVYLLDRGSITKSRLLRFVYRSFSVLTGILINNNRWSALKALNVSQFGQQAKSLLLATIIAKLSKQLSFDIILAHFGFNGVTANQLRELGVFQGKIATIFHGHDISSVQALAQRNKSYQALFQQTELMLPISELWKKKLIELGCPDTKIIVHRMGVDLASFQYNENLLNQERESLKIFTVARFAEKKGLKYAIKAMALLKSNTGIDFYYTLAGFGELSDELQQLVIELNLSKEVSFIGEINSEQVKSYMQHADVFLQPSVTAKNGDMEGVPVTIMEAMAMGTVVVSTFHSGIPELITHNKHGLLANERDEVAIAQHLESIALDKEHAQDLAVNARNRIEQIGNVDQLNKDLIKLLKK